MKRTHVFSFVMLACLGAGPSFGQVPGASQQVESVQQRRQLDKNAEQMESESAPELYPGEASDTGPQSVLRAKPRRSWFEAQGDVQYFYTDNMFLTENNEQPSDVLVSTIQLALAPSAFNVCEGELTPRLGYRHQWFSYGLWGDELNFTTLKLHEFNFNAQTPFADVRWSRENWIFDVGFDFQRLMDSEEYEEFYKEYVPRWGLQRVIPLCPSSALAVGYFGDYRFTEEAVPFFLASDLNDRTDHGLFVNLTASLCSHVIVQPYYRFKYTHFTAENIDRDDYLHSVGIALHYFITRNISVRAFVNYDILDSSNALVPEYKKLDTGGGVNLTMRF